MTTDKLQRVMNPATRTATNTWKYDGGLTNAWRHDLYWYNVSDTTSCVDYRLCVYVYKWLHRLAPQYLSELCQPVTIVLACQLGALPIVAC